MATRFHSDYPSFYTDIPPHERPGSMILALDDFKFISQLFLGMKLLTSMYHQCMQYSSPTLVCILGERTYPQNPKFDFLLIKVSDGSHLPSNSVTKFEWRNYNKDDLKAVIMHPWGKAGKRGDGEDEEDESRGPNADGRKYAQGVGSKRKRGKDPRNSRQREQ